MSLPPFPRRLMPIVAAGLALTCMSLHAAPPKREGTLGGGKGSGPIMSMAQLRACVTQQGRLQSQGDETTKVQQQLATERADIERSSAALKDDMAALDRTNKEAVEAYVGRSKAHDERIDAYQSKVPAFNAKVEAMNAERVSYNQACEGRRFLEDDLKDIKAGK